MDTGRDGCVDARALREREDDVGPAHGPRSEHAPGPDDRPHAIDDEVRAAIAFVLVDGVGSGRLRRLRESFGSARAALAASEDEVGARLAEALRCDAAAAARIVAEARAVDAARELSTISAHGARVLLAGDPRYPALLAAGVDAPELLVVRGELESPPELAVAIVGSRRATHYGRVQAGRLAVELAERGVTVVSGGARGIDAEAHRGALRAGGRTIAVLATGVARPYPPEHAPLFDEIVASGGATIGEQPSFVAARPELFPRRNRIIAGLSLVTVVVEAANRSGALLTARLAVDDHARDAACMPGPVDSASSEGCHRAIREGWAQLVTNADDVCEMLAETRSLVDGALERQRSLARALAPRHASSEFSRQASSEVSRQASHQASSQAARDSSNAGPRQATRRARLSREARCASNDAGDRRDARAPGSAIEPRDQTPPFEPGSDPEVVLRTIRELRGAGLDELERALGWEVPRLATATLVLEIRGFVRRAADGALEAVRDAARAVAPKVVPEVALDAALDAAPEAAPEVAPEAALEAAREASRDAAPEVARDAAPTAAGRD